MNLNVDEDSTIDRQFAKSDITETLDKVQQADTRLYGNRLFLARAACIAAGVISLGVFITSLPANYSAILALLCTGPLCIHSSQTTIQFVQQLQALGLSAQAYAIFYIVLNIIFVCIYFIVAVVLFWRRSDDWMALFASFFLMTFAINFSSNTLVAAPSLLYRFVEFLGATSIVVFFYLFPTGRFVPRWTRWLSIGAILYWGFKYFLPASPFNPYNNFIFSTFWFLVFVGAIIVAQVYRYLRVSNYVQRQQTKWVVFGVSIAIGGYIIIVLFYSLFYADAPRSPLPVILFNIFA